MKWDHDTFSADLTMTMSMRTEWELWSARVLKMRIICYKFLFSSPVYITISSNALSEYTLNLNVSMLITILMERREQLMIWKEKKKVLLKTKYQKLKECDLIHYFISNGTFLRWLKKSSHYGCFLGTLRILTSWLVLSSWMDF